MESSVTRAFFRDIFNASLATIERFPLTGKPPLMDYVTGVLEPAVQDHRTSLPFGDVPDEVARERRVALAAANEEAGVAVGLNTVGLLLDRLSILSMKHWNLVNRAGDSDKAETLVSTQIAELISALSTSRPGHSSVNNKITTRKVEAEASSFGQAYYGLLTTNLLLWEAQEVLYNHDILSLPEAELRAYIDFFSRGNLQRNVFIQRTDDTFWEAVGV